MKSPVSKIALGTAQFGLRYGVNNQAGQPSTASAHEILSGCLAQGVVALDTAEAYGTAQDVLGQFIRDKSEAKQFAIHTKFKVSSPSFNIEENLKRSLSTLGVASVECYYFHDYSDFTKCNFLADLAYLKKSSLVSKIGVSVYTPSEAMIALQTSEIDQIQIPYNVLDNYHRWSVVLTEAKQRQKIVHSRSVFLQGLFFKNQDQLSKDVPHLKGIFSAIDKLKTIAYREGLTLEQLCLFYALQTSEIDKVVIGLETSQQLRKNLETIKNFRDLSVYQEISDIQVQDENLLNPAKWSQLKEKI